MRWSRSGATVFDCVAMKLMSFAHQGRVSYGAWTPEGIHDLGASLDPTLTDVPSLLAAENGLQLAAMQVASGTSPRLQDSDVTWLPPVPRPSKIFCIGVNYADHAAETQIATAAHPTVFTRFADTQIGHQQPLLMPMESAQFDFEGEMAVVIGKPGRRIAAADAWDHIAGCACYNDASVRDWQFHSTQWGPGKNFQHTGAFGPWLVTRDEIDPSQQALTLTTRLNGQVVQQASTRDLIFDVPALVAYCSTLIELRPGDVIVTGTPAGVGLSRKPPLYMRPGDQVEVEITGLGVLQNTVMRG